MFSPFQVLCKWWIKQDVSWSTEVLISSMPLWQRPCAAPLAPLSWRGSTSTTTTLTPTMRTVLLHPGRLSMKYVPLLCTSTIQATGQVRSRLGASESFLRLTSTEANVCNILILISSWRQQCFMPELKCCFSFLVFLLEEIFIYKQTANRNPKTSVFQKMGIKYCACLNWRPSKPTIWPTITWSVQKTQERQYEKVLVFLLFS